MHWIENDNASDRAVESALLKSRHNVPQSHNHWRRAEAIERLRLKLRSQSTDFLALKVRDMADCLRCEHRRHSIKKKCHAMKSFVGSEPQNELQQRGVQGKPVCMLHRIDQTWRCQYFETLIDADEEFWW